LKHLAKGSDATLKDLAQRDLAQPVAVDQQRALADGYWDLSKKADPPAKSALAHRARHWYFGASPWVGGDPAIENRIKEIDRDGSAGKIQFISELPEQKLVIPDFRRRRLTAAGKSSPHGLWMHPPQYNSFSTVTYDLHRRARTLYAYVRVTDDSLPFTALAFQVFGDGKLLWMSPPVAKGDAVRCEARLNEVRFLELRVNCPGRNEGAGGAWFEPQILWK
jgi:hypothetical protein